MSSRSWVAVALALAGLLGLLDAGAARASEYALPQLISRPSSTAQPNGAVQQIAASEDGRYLLYRTDATDLAPPGSSPGPSGLQQAGGIYRYDTTTGASALVADTYYADTNTNPEGAEDASISDDGRWVLFDTDVLFPEDPSRPDAGGYTHTVYVRDMDAPADRRSSFAQPLPEGTDAKAIGNHGLSGDGTRLLWRDTRGFIRWTDTVAHVSRPVSVAYDPSTDTMDPSQPLADVIGPALSGDGTTVAWYAMNVTAATPMVPGEADADAATQFGRGTEGMLWRRVADGDRARTRRVTSQFDSENPACTAATPATVDPAPPGPCDNPTLDTATSSDGQNLPRGDDPSSGQGAGLISLSDDGQRLAVICSGHARGSNLPRNPELYVVTMFPGQDRAQSTIPLTREVQPPPGTVVQSPSNAPTSAPILAASISGNGRYVSFVTQRVLFTLSPPTFVGPASPIADAQELYVADLQAGTVQLLSQTPSGAKQDDGPPTQASTGGATDPSISDDGSAIAFISNATNLAPGDANGFPDAFLIARNPASAGSDQTGPEVEQLPPVAPNLVPAPTFSLLVDRVAAHAGGTVTMIVETPAAGTLTASAADAGRTLSRATATSGAPAPLTLTLVPHVTGRDGAPGVRRRRATHAMLRFTPTRPSVGPPIALSVPVAFDLPAAKLGVHVVAIPAASRLALAVRTPGAGRVTVVVTARRTPHARPVTLGRARLRARSARTLRSRLHLDARALARIGRGRVRVSAAAAFTPASPGPIPALRTTTSTLVPSSRGAR